MRFEAQVKRAKSPLTYSMARTSECRCLEGGTSIRAASCALSDDPFYMRFAVTEPAKCYPGLPKPARQVNSQTAWPDFGSVPARVGSIQCFHLEPSWSARVRAVHQLRNGSKGTFCERMDDSVEPGTKEHFGGAVIITIARRTSRSAGAWLFPCRPCLPCRAASRVPMCA
jgi:hypothetical protein